MLFMSYTTTINDIRKYNTYYYRDNNELNELNQKL